MKEKRKGTENKPKPEAVCCYLLMSMFVFKRHESKRIYEYLSAYAHRKLSSISSENHGKETKTRKMRHRKHNSYHTVSAAIPAHHLRKNRIQLPHTFAVSPFSSPAAGRITTRTLSSRDVIWLSNAMRCKEYSRPPTPAWSILIKIKSSAKRMYDMIVC